MLLGRFADARLRRELEKTRDSRESWRRAALGLASSLRAARTANVNLARDLAAERARNQETTP